MASSSAAPTTSAQGAEATVVLVSPDGMGGVAPITAQVRMLGLSPVLLTGALRPATRARLAQLVDQIVVVDEWTDPACLAATAQRVADGTPRGLFGCSDAAVVVAAHAAALLGIGYSPVAGLERARNKYVTRRTLREAGLATPPFALIDDATRAAEVAALVGLPAVIKPVNGSAGSLVRRVGTVAELAEAYRVLAERAPTAMSGVYALPVPDPDGSPIDASRTFLVEGLLRGREYCTDVVIRDGAVEQIVLLEKFLIDDDFFEQGFVWPPLPTSEADEDLIASVVEDAVLALGLDNVNAHVEIIDDVVSGPTVIEVNAGRCGGQMIPTLTEYGTGVSLFAEQVALALGAPPPPRRAPRLPPPLATLTVFSAESGRLTAIHGLDKVAQHPDVMIAATLMQPGEFISTDYEMFPVNVLVAGLETREELIAAYAEISALVRFEIEPVESVSTSAAAQLR